MPWGFDIVTRNPFAAGNLTLRSKDDVLPSCSALSPFGQNKIKPKRWRFFLVA